MTDAERLEKNLSGIMLLCDMIEIYYLNSVKDFKFQRVQIERKANAIRRFAKEIKHAEAGKFMRIDPNKADLMENEQALHLWRIVDAFQYFPTDKLEIFADQLEAKLAEGRKENKK